MAVDKCTDPLEVSVKVYDGFGALNLSIIVTETGDIQGSDYRVDMFSRDEFNLRISVSIIIMYNYSYHHVNINSTC